MASKEFKEIQIVAHVKEALKELADYLGVDPVLSLNPPELKKWNDLEKRYAEFYKLPLKERYIFAGLITDPSLKAK